MKLLDRAILAADRRLVLLAPPSTAVPDHFGRVQFDLERHQRLLNAVQRFRGSVYLNDGAITTEQLTGNGRHETPEDERSWHLVMLRGEDEVVASAWYLDHRNDVYFDRLRLRHIPVAPTSEWRETLWHAVNRDIAQARGHGVRYAEVGGWAVSDDSRRSCDGLLVALAAYALARICGHTIGITMATVKHGSSNILCKIGGQPLALNGSQLPPYYDDRYRCVMEILRFDSRYPSPRFASLIERLYQSLSQVSVVARPYWPTSFRSVAGALVDTGSSHTLSWPDLQLAIA